MVICSSAKFTLSARERLKVSDSSELYMAMNWYACEKTSGSPSMKAPEVTHPKYASLISLTSFIRIIHTHHTLYSFHLFDILTTVLVFKSLVIT
ncbi:hypothetical protein WG66_012040 [Moniliophthora roreri]|nr:hypothetical protein WG66_012040 [Moniliophthora roreri]